MTKLIPLMLFSLIACSHMPKDTITKNLDHGFKYHLVKDKVLISAQPEMKDLKGLKDKENIVAVVNVRNKSELKDLSYNPEEQAKELGLKFYNIPVMKKGELQKDQITKVEETVTKEVKNGRVLVHCSSGNRASAWLASHMKFGHGLSTDEAISFAKKSGMTKEGIEKKTKELLEK